jgi:hypothetical protein
MGINSGYPEEMLENAGDGSFSRYYFNKKLVFINGNKSRQLLQKTKPQLSWFGFSLCECGLRDISFL